MSQYIEKVKKTCNYNYYFTTAIYEVCIDL